jgi:hypothetical protein
MSTGPFPPTEAWPLWLVQAVDAACLRFEAAWKAGRQPRIEEYLGAAAGKEGAAFLSELLALELALRRRAGHTPQPVEYQTRFPVYAALIGAVFRQTLPSRSPPAGGPARASPPEMGLDRSSPAVPGAAPPTLPSAPFGVGASETPAPVPAPWPADRVSGRVRLPGPGPTTR